MKIRNVAALTAAFMVAYFAGVLFGKVLAAEPNAAKPDTDLPHEQPLTATGFVYCEPGTDRKSIVAVVMTYPSGAFVRFDKDHMHGLTSVADLVKYADSAGNTAVYGAGLCNAQST